jgi:hypothetical protein
VEPKTELELYEMLLMMYLKGFVYWLRKMPPDKWDWTPDQAAPTARIVAVHAWQWLICDRQHIIEPDARQHTPVPEPPDDPEAFCVAFDAETENWRQLLRGLTPEELDSPRRQFNLPDSKMNVRGFIGHILQNTIYKNGQFTTLYFALGLDGTEPYDAPFPNPIYEEVVWSKADKGSE